MQNTQRSQPITWLIFKKINKNTTDFASDQLRAESNTKLIHQR